MDLFTQKQWFDSQEFQDKFHCDIPLGSFCSPSGTVFRLWAPTAQSVKLILYEQGNGGTPTAVADLQRAENGLWAYHASRNLDGMY